MILVIDDVDNIINGGVEWYTNPGKKIVRRKRFMPFFKGADIEAHREKG